MSKENHIVDKYIECFDDCKPIVYKGITISPFLTKNIRLCNYACYCLVLDPVDLNDISLMPLKRLDLIITIFERLVNNQLPKDNEVVEKYQLVAQSFQLLLKNVFRGYKFDFSDPGNSNRKKVLTLIDEKNLSYQVFNVKEFEDICDLILYHNGIDVSYKKYPAAMRKELERNLRLRQKQNKDKAPSIEKMIDSAFLFVHSYKKILDLPVRKFYNLILNIQKKEEYSILMSGMYITKNVSHWMSGNYDRDPYKEILGTEEQTLDKFKNL